MVLRCTIVLLCLILLPVTARSQPGLAVLPFRTVGIDSRLSAIVADAVRNEISDIGEYVVLRRERMQEILERHAFLDTTCYERVCAVEMGKVLTVDKVLLGTVTKRGDEVYLESSIIDVATGREDAAADKVIPYSSEISPFRKAGGQMVRSLLGYPVIERGWRKWIVPVGMITAGIVYLIQEWRKEEVGNADIVARFPGR